MKVWLVLSTAVLSAAGYACSATDASILGSKDDLSGNDGGVQDEQDAQGQQSVQDDGGTNDNDSADASSEDASILDGGGLNEPCEDGKCSTPNAFCAYRIQDACSAVGECMIPAYNGCLPNWVKIGCDCSGKTMFSGSGCETNGLPEGYAYWPMSERFEDPSSAKPCPNDPPDGG